MCSGSASVLFLYTMCKIQNENNIAVGFYAMIEAAKTKAKELVRLMELTFYPGALCGEMAAPASKSEAHRRMICAGLSRGTTLLGGFMDSGDTEATGRCLTALGASIRQSTGCMIITGNADGLTRLPVLDCGESGSTLRFFVPIALARAGGGVFRMHGRLSQRPMDVYRDLFVPRGVKWRMGIGCDGAAELKVYGRLEAGKYVLPGNVSSQFVSGLLFAMPLLRGDSTLQVEPPVESVGYIRMTLDALKQSGIEVREREPFCWQIPGEQQYRAVDGNLAGDYSQAAVFLCAGALGHPVTVTRLSADTVQGDRRILEYLSMLGASVEEDAQRVTVRGGSLRGAALNLSDCPDIAPMLALVCQHAQGESRLSGCGRLRLKECDRLSATVAMLNRLGGNAREDGDDIVIRGVERLKGGITLPDDHDHRMVMLAAIAASVAQEPVRVAGVEALNKSWPGFLEVYRSLGGKAE